MTTWPDGVPLDPSPLDPSQVEWWWEEKTETPFSVNVNISGLPSTCSAKVFVDGTYYDTVAGGELLTLEFTAKPKIICVDQGVNGLQDTRYSCSSDSWTASSAGSRTFTYDTEYMLSVDSQYGNAEGGGWYKGGTLAVFLVSPSTLDYGNQTRLRFVGWTGDCTATEPNATLIVDNPKHVTARWEPQYYLTVLSDRGDPQGSGWYEEGSSATFSVTSPAPISGILGVLGVKNVFDKWTGNCTATSASASLVMDSPKIATATWRTDYTMFYLVIVGIAVVVAVPLLAVLVRRRRRGSVSRV